MTSADREEQLLDTIEQLTKASGYPPSLREIATAMGVSLTRVAQLVIAAEEAGRLERHPKIARSWRVIRPTSRSR